MTTLRVTAADDRSPLVIDGRGLGVAERVALAAAAGRCGLLSAGAGWAALHPERVVSLFVDLDWDCDADAAAARALDEPWSAAASSASEWIAPGEALVRAQGCTLRPYQEIGARRLRRSPGGLILADSPGLGKTVQVLAALPPGAAVNVACPRNAVPTWEDEVARWRPDLAVRSLRKRGSAAPATAGEAVVGTLESLPALEWARRGSVESGSVLVCDEAHALKGESAQAERFRTWSDAVRAARGWVWLLTGTPCLNADPEELWRLLDACGRAHDTLGPRGALRDLFAHEVDRVWVPRRRRGTGAEVALRAESVDLCAVTAESVEVDRAIAGSYVEHVRWTGAHPAWVDDALARAVLRRTKERVAKDLPSLSYQTVRVHVPRSALAELVRSDAARRLDVELAALERALGSGARDDELDRLASQPAVSTARRLLATAKVGATREVLVDLEAANEPALLFGCHVEPVRSLGSHAGWATIDGAVTGDRRGRVRTEFQAGQWTTCGAGPALGVAMTIRAASESLTLTRAAHVVFLEEDWVPARNLQAVARSHRMTQTRPVTVIRIVADHPIDRRVAAAIAAKDAFSGALLAGVEDR